MKHIIATFCKGGSGKSSLIRYTASTLQRLNYKVLVENIDEQHHQNCNPVENPDFTLYDTPGWLTSELIELLDAASDLVKENKEDLKILVPISCSLDEWQEFGLMLNILGSRHLLDNIVVIFNQTDYRNTDLKAYKALLKEININYAKTIIPSITAIKRKQETSKIKNVFSQLLHEVIL